MNEMYYNGYKTLTYNALFNFIVGNRGAGKTYWCKRWAIKDYLNNGKEFIYVRRYKAELKKIKTFFNDISLEFPEHKFSCNGSMFFIDDKVAGYTICLSTSKIEKSVAYPNVNKIIFDEFLLDRGAYRYLPDEVESFLELYETVARMRDNVIVFFLSNAISNVNPYFMYFDIELPEKNRVFRRGELLVENLANDEFIQKKKETRFGKLISGTLYGDYAINNTMLRDSNDFIRKKDTPCTPYFNFIFKGYEYGVWRDDKGQYLYVENKFNTSAYVFAPLQIDYKEGTIQGDLFRDSVYWRTLCNYLRLSLLYFNNAQSKKATYEMISKFIRW